MVGPSPDAATPSSAASSPDHGCALHGVMTNYLEHDQNVASLRASPLWRTIEAVRVGAPLPRLPAEASSWVDGGTGLESLTIAAWLRCPPLVRALLEAGTPPDGAQPQGHTPAMWAASLAEWGVVEVLLDAGADPLRMDPRQPGTSVLSNAASLGSVPLVRRVLDEADVPRSDPAIVEALDMAVAAERPETARLFLDAGVRPSPFALLTAANTVSRPDLFDTLAAAAERADYAGVAATEDIAHLGMICHELSAPDSADRYRPGDIERIADLLGEELPC